MSDDELDPLAILAALGVSGATAAVPVSGGWDTSIWRVECAGEAYALRVFRAGEEDTCRREVEVMRTAATGGVPVPAVHAQGLWRDRAAMLLSWCAGQPVRHQAQASPARIWRLGIAFGQMQARIHSLPAPDVLCQSGDRDWIDWAGPEEERLQERLRAVAGHSKQLLHLDYHPLNVMADGATITGVLDWTNARAGDPRADLARTFTILCVMPVPPGPQALTLRAARRVLARGWRRGYRQAVETGGGAGGIAPDEDRALFLAWAGAVMALDFAPKIGRPGVWLQPHHLDRIRRWANAWKRRAGIFAG
jgi:aminoglycoside phosphotransferase (APT) family kinase protein